MNGFLLLSSGNTLGFALVSEGRRIRIVSYLALENRLHLTYSDNKEETLPTEIDPAFSRALLCRKQVMIGHFMPDGFGQAPTEEYTVPLHL